MAIDFGSSLSNYHSAADAAHLDLGTEAFGIICRVRVDDTNAKTIVYKGDSTARYELTINSDGTVTMTTRAASTSSTFTSTAKVVRDGATWNFVAAVRQRSVLGGKIAIQIGTTYAQSGSLTIRNVDNTEPLHIGQGGGANPCDGIEHLIIIKGYDPTPAQLAKIYSDVMEVRQVSGDIVLWLPFIEGDATNWSTRSSTITVNGSPTKVSGFSRLPLTVTPITNDAATVGEAWSLTIPADTFTVSDPRSYIAKEGNHYVFQGDFTFPSGIYVAALDKTFVTFQGYDADPVIVNYNHATGAVSAPVRIGTNPVTNSDTHTTPAIAHLPSGKFLVAYGSHITDQKLARSTNANDDSAWDALSDISGDFTYNKPFVVGSDVYLFYRDSLAGPTEPAGYRKSTDEGDTWGSFVEVIDAGTTSGGADAIYIVGGEVDGTDIHLWWTYNYNHGGGVVERENLYYAIYDTVAVALKDVDGTALTTPLTKATADANAKVRALNTEAGGTIYVNNPSGIRDSSGNPHFVSHYYDGSIWKYVHTRWNGSAWTTIEVLPDSASGSIQRYGTLVNGPNDTLLFYGMKGTQDTTNGNASMYRWTYASGTWGDPELIASYGWPDGGIGHSVPSSIMNAHADFRVAWGQYTDTYASAWTAKVFAHGDSGFVIDPLEKQVSAQNVTLANGDPLPSWITFSAGELSGTPSRPETLSLKAEVTGTGYVPASDTFNALLTGGNSVDQWLLEGTTDAWLLEGSTDAWMTEGETEVQPEPQPDPDPPPAGSSGRQTVRFTTKHKGEYYSFATLEDLERFVRENEDKPVEKKKKKKQKKPVIKVAPEFQQELYEYDLPALQPVIDQADYTQLRAIMDRYNAMQAMAHMEMLRAIRQRQDDEEVLLLIA